MVAPSERMNAWPTKFMACFNAYSHGDRRRRPRRPQGRPSAPSTAPLACSVGGIFTFEADDDQIAHPSSPLARAPPIAPDRPTHLVDNFRVEGPRCAEPPTHRCGPPGILLRLALILRGEAEVSSQSEPDTLAGRRQKARPIRRRAGQLGAGISTWPRTTPSLHIFISCRTSSMF
jgi:hypothetical protein